MSDPRTIHHIFIAGAGVMGHGIAQVAASTGVHVTLYDFNAEALRSAVEKMRWSLEKLHAKGRIPDSADVVLSRIKTTSDLANAALAELVIEAAPEREALKRDLFSRLDAICPAHVIFASNTSAIPITKLAAATERADRFCGLHFFNPVPMLSLVEVVRGSHSSDDTIAAAMAFARQIGKDPVLVQRDKAGFIVNRILGAAVGEAIRLRDAGIADAKDIDKAMRLGCAWKMGPLETADLAGLDVMLHMLEAMQQDGPDPVLMPPDALRTLVAKGQLGRKSGRGFYDHTQGAVAS
jgi:3-hydroxybutyryl-CoA dehydrogenase